MRIQASCLRCFFLLLALLAPALAVHAQEGGGSASPVVGAIVFTRMDGQRAEIFTVNPDGTGQQLFPAGDFPVIVDPAWSPDGSRLAFAAESEGGLHLHVINTDGSELRCLTSAGQHNRAPAWSPDGTQIAFMSDRNGSWDLFTISADGTSERTVADHPADDTVPEWSPDGERIVFASNRDGDFELYVLTLASGDLIQLTDNDAADNDPAWSPDGTQIAFTTARGDTEDVYLMNPDGSDQRPLVSSRANDKQPAWSPDGTQLLFASGVVDANGAGKINIFLMNVDGSGLIQLTDQTSTLNVSPCWRYIPVSLPATLEGMIAFSSERSGAGEIYVMAPNGEGLQRLTDFAERVGYPAGSPDGTRIAAYGYHGRGTWSIHVMNIDGSDPQRLTFRSNMLDSAPSWSPDGTEIVFSSGDLTRSEMWIMNADGTNLRRLLSDLPPEQAVDSGPDWSPDGTQIVFVSSRDGDGDIYTMNLDGTNVHAITDNNANDWWPAWSPDGTQIAFMSDRDGDFEIYVMDVDGSNIRQLTDNDADDWRASWSPDGSRLVFTSFRDRNFEIYVMNADGSDQIRLTNDYSADNQPAWLPYFGE